MKKNFVPKYKYYTDDKRVVAVSTYAKKNVRGVAVCNDDDVFDFDFGKKLAKIRCDRKINEKRLKYLNDRVEKFNALIDYFVCDRDNIINLINDTFDTIHELDLEEERILEK